MTDINSLPPGSFCWPELATSDQKAGTAFYTKLFGWSQKDNDMGPAGVYSIFQMRGRDVAAAGGEAARRPSALEHVHQRRECGRGSQTGAGARRQSDGAGL